jgi:hypothetical protein
MSDQRAKRIQSISYSRKGTNKIAEQKLTKTKPTKRNSKAACKLEKPLPKAISRRATPGTIFKTNEDN